MCQQWRQHAFPRWHWGTILKYSTFHNPPFVQLVYELSIQVLLMIAWLHQFNAIKWEYQRFSRFMRIDYCLLHFSNRSLNLICPYQYLLLYFIDIKFHCFEMMKNNFFNSKDSDIFNVDQSSVKLSPGRIFTPEILNWRTIRGTCDRAHYILIRSVSGTPNHYNTFGS